MKNIDGKYRLRVKIETSGVDAWFINKNNEKINHHEIFEEKFDCIRHCFSFNALSVSRTEYDPNMYIIGGLEDVRIKFSDGIVRRKSIDNVKVGTGKLPQTILSRFRKISEWIDGIEKSIETMNVTYPLLFGNQKNKKTMHIKYLLHGTATAEIPKNWDELDDDKKENYARKILESKSSDEINNGTKDKERAYVHPQAIVVESSDLEYDMSTELWEKYIQDDSEPLCSEPEELDLRKE